MMDIHKILKQLPHRYPFLLVDRVLELHKGKTIKALKNVTINEPFFEGHFPHRPVMPGVLMLEAMAQAAGMSRSAFAARFRAVVGSTPADYLSDWRMTIARSLLTTGYSVKHIADALGYANASALSRVFAQRVGVPPRVWVASEVQQQDHKIATK